MQAGLCQLWLGGSRSHFPACFQPQGTSDFCLVLLCPHVRVTCCGSLQLGVSRAALHPDSVLVRALWLWGCGSFSSQPIWAQLLGSSTPVLPLPESGGIISVGFLQRSPLEQEQGVSREGQVAKEPLSERRRFGVAPVPGLCCTATASSHPRGPRAVLQPCACPACRCSSCPAGAPPALASPPAWRAECFPCNHFLSWLPGCSLALPRCCSPGIVLCSAAGATTISGGALPGVEVSPLWPAR